jgi:CBS domain-containing protein
MSLRYSVIEIFTTEEARIGHRPLHEAVVEYVAGLKLAARCLVFRAQGGSFESGEIASQSILTISYNMPLKIEIVLPASEAEGVVRHLEEMVGDGLLSLRDLPVRAYRTRQHLVPRQIKVKDVMTREVASATPGTRLDEAARTLLPAVFGALPVVDTAGRPVGLITRGDLIYRAGMPVRLGLLAHSDAARREAVLEKLAHRTVAEVMSRPVVQVHADQRLTEAVDLMIKKGLKRLPVVDGDGVLAGMLSRLDVFRTITRGGADRQALREREVEVRNLRFVSDIMGRDTQTVAPETPLEAVLRIIDAGASRRVAVVDGTGRFLGLIADRDLLAAFTGRGLGFWDYLACRLGHGREEICGSELRRTLMEKTAGEVMRTDLVMVGEHTPIEEAVSLMIDKRLKRLPVVDAEGRFRGMIRREMVLRAALQD